ncbi:hypothetical protein M758_4G059600 [Ceratodon purpureus]|uniref:Uncharacterized protein n=1 Tax=Ceratodon purpureus TaxID=3225 RepID=A0A8T0I782_CERPU|nr:hypothetical protein KC19_4G058900 [Ceratodon purpureus]KAG0618387.1 hypothetical protein M758_4G059600 [Ceratodon purpureus]
MRDGFSSTPSHQFHDLHQTPHHADSLPNSEYGRTRNIGHAQPLANAIIRGKFQKKSELWKEIKSRRTGDEDDARRQPQVKRSCREAPRERAKKAQAATHRR